MKIQAMKNAAEKIILSDVQKYRILAGCTQPRKKGWSALVPSLAASLCIVFLAVVWNVGKTAVPSDVTLPMSQTGGLQDPQEISTWSSPSETISAEEIDQIVINDWSDSLETDMALARWCFDPEVCEIVTWTWEQAEDYFGMPIAVSAVPEDLSAEPSGGSGRLIRRWDDGTVIIDAASLTYWNGWYEDGSPLFAGDGGRGFTLTVNAEGMNFRDYILVPKDQMGLSTIDGTEVMIGHRIFGSYYDTQGEPQVTWDVYFAQFELEGVCFEIETENMNQEELIHIIKDLIPL